MRLQVLQGDTIAVWDFMFRPVYYFDPSGKLLRERRIDLGALIAATRTGNQHPGETVHLPLPDGSFLIETVPSDWQPPAEPGQDLQAPDRIREDRFHVLCAFLRLVGRAGTPLVRT